MTTHVNFYENLTEAQMRLNRTIVMYDKEPYYVRAICNHKGDGVFRMYLEPIKKVGSKLRGGPMYDMYYGMDNFSTEDPALGTFIDGFLEKNKDCHILRKKMNSPMFNRFRPFPLGMVNIGEDENAGTQARGRCYFTERRPVRNREQGLTAAAVSETLVTLAPPSGMRAPQVVPMYSGCFYDMIMGNYPSAQEAYEALRDPDVTNEAIAFHRQFAFVRGPVDTMFLAYKDKIIGLVDAYAPRIIKLGKQYKHLKEVTEELKFFDAVRV